MPKISSRNYLSGPITGLSLAAQCDWDKEKILEILIDALTDANGHSEAKEVKRILEQVRRAG